MQTHSWIVESRDEMSPERLHGCPIKYSFYNKQVQTLLYMQYNLISLNNTVKFEHFQTTMQQVKKVFHIQIVHKKCRVQLNICRASPKILIK